MSFRVIDGTGYYYGCISSNATEESKLIFKCFRVFGKGISFNSDMFYQDDTNTFMMLGEKGMLVASNTSAHENSAYNFLVRQKLQFLETGVFENHRSPKVYINDDLELIHAIINHDQLGVHKFNSQSISTKLLNREKHKFLEDVAGSNTKLGNYHCFIKGLDLVRARALKTVIRQSTNKERPIHNDLASQLQSKEYIICGETMVWVTMTEKRTKIGKTVKPRFAQEMIYIPPQLWDSDTVLWLKSVMQNQQASKIQPILPKTR